MLNSSLKRLQQFTDLGVFYAKKYVYTINHKRIALNYFYFSLVSGLAGLSLATMIRIELALPGSHFFKGDSIKYLQVITTHALVMIFFVVIPIFFGFFANFFVPYHIGAKDVAFPRLNSIGFWLQPAAFVLLAKMAFLRPQINRSYDRQSEYEYWLTFKKPTLEFPTFLFWQPASSTRMALDTQSSPKGLISGNTMLTARQLVSTATKTLQLRPSRWFSNNDALQKKKNLYFIKCSNSTYTLPGWAFITPFSASTRYTSVGAQDVAILSVLFAGLSTTLSFTNLLITRRTLSMPGLRNRKSLVPFLSLTLFTVMRVLTLITPVLGAAMLMLFADRHLHTSFFDYAYGGDVILFNHLFWFFGHPEVYVVMIPGFGVVNSLLPYYTNRRIASKNHLIWATYIMAYMGFLVWGHHMFLVGLDHRARALYSTITIMISLPAVVKIVNWTLTITNGMTRSELPMLYVYAFILFFLSGGLTGMWLAHISLNLYVHDTFYVIAHFHFLFSSAVFSSIFAALYHYYPVIFGIKYSKPFAYLQLAYWFAGQWLTFLPLYAIGYNGLPRRYHDYPLMFLGWNSLASAGHLLTILSFVFFFAGFLDSKLQNRSGRSVNYNLPRLYNRLAYYTFKIQYKKHHRSYLSY